jgi:hypothetical protein
MNLVDQINIINNVPIEVEPHEPVPPRIKGLIITDINDSGSMYKARKCGISIEKTQSKIDYTVFPSTLPSAVARDLKKITYLETPELLPWTWPTKKEEECIDFKTGLYKTFENSLDQSKLITETVSHMRAWQYCIDINQPIIIMNYDTEWITKFDFNNIHKESNKSDDIDEVKRSPRLFKGGIVSLKTPTTIIDGIEYNLLSTGNLPNGLNPISSSTLLGQNNIPISIKDSGTYLITPWAAKKLLDQIEYNGMWPPHILINRQLFKWIQIYTPFHTQGQKS